VSAQGEAGQAATVYAWRFGRDDSQLALRLRGVANTGIDDVSKDAALAVDRLLQVNASSTP